MSPSRLLNEQRTVMGLYVSDFGAAFALFAFLSKVFESTQFGVLAIVGALLGLVVVAPLRLTLRKHIVRDTLTWFVSNKRLFDPRRRSEKSYAS